MKIPVILQTELTNELYQYEMDLLNQIKSFPINKESTTADIGVRDWLKGKQAGISTARMIINAWNEPNHGKVKVQLN
jgi:hypothetical protein